MLRSASEGHCTIAHQVPVHPTTHIAPTAATPPMHAICSAEGIALSDGALYTGDAIAAVQRFRRSNPPNTSHIENGQIFGERYGRLVSTRPTEKADGIKLSPALQPVWGSRLPVQAWRMPWMPASSPRTQSVHNTPFFHGTLTACSVRSIASWQRYRLDVWRDRQEDFFDKNAFRTNASGLLERSTFPVLYRVDSRSPEILLQSDGFGTSRRNSGIRPMIEPAVLVTSACLRASDYVLYESSVPSATHAQGYAFQYAIRSEGVVAASWLENFKYLDRPVTIEGHSFELNLDETHIDASAVTPDRIFLVGSDDPLVEWKLAAMHASGLSGLFGVSILEYCAWETRVQAALDEDASLLDALERSVSVVAPPPQLPPAPHALSRDLRIRAWVDASADQLGTQDVRLAQCPENLV